MFIKDIDPERLKLLTPDQLKIVERWNREAEERTKLIDSYGVDGTITKEEARTLGRKLMAIGAEYCEHGRHKHSAHCHGCEDIERILCPGVYEDDE